MVTTTYTCPTPAPRVDPPKWTAKDILGVSGSRPKYRGGLARYATDRRAHRAYRAWHTSLAPRLFRNPLAAN
jgi:hypothetical protein